MTDERKAQLLEIANAYKAGEISAIEVMNRVEAGITPRGRIVNHGDGTFTYYWGDAAECDGNTPDCDCDKCKANDSHPPRH